MNKEEKESQLSQVASIYGNTKFDGVYKKLSIMNKLEFLTSLAEK